MESSLQCNSTGELDFRNNVIKENYLNNNKRNEK